MKKQIFISSVQSEFAKERKQLADYIRQDVLFSRYFEPFLFEAEEFLQKLNAEYEAEVRAL